MGSGPGQTSPSPGSAILGHGLLRTAAGAGSVLVGLALAGSLPPAHLHGSLVWLSGWLGSAAYAAELLASLPLGVAADVLPPAALMLGGAVLSAVALLLFTLAASLPLWFFSRVLAGAAAAGVTPPLLAVLARERHGAARRARLMSLFELSMLAGLAAGPVLAAQLWAHTAYGAFAWCALLCLPAALLLYRGARSTRLAGLNPGAVAQGDVDGLAAAALAALRAALRDPSLRRLAPAWLCFNSIIGLWLAPTVTYLLSAPDGRHAQYLDGLFAQRPMALAWLFAAYAAIFAAGLAAWALVLGRVGPARTLRIALLAMLAVSGVLFLLNRCGACQPGGRTALVVLAALLVMVESGFTPAALSWLSASVGAQRAAGAAMGIYTVLFSIGGALGAMLAGALGHAGGMNGLLFGTVALAILAWASLPSGRQAVLDTAT
ncbi:MAG TPA: MFS transporter [Steroidobacteraceae bacterium]|nr:MFS transporter [Steroidobacteraceae bacterium]